jgi:sugar phosphate isomerase/epimerase
VDHLKNAGYNGVISVETEGGDDFDEIVALAAKSYAYLNNIIKA